MLNSLLQSRFFETLSYCKALQIVVLWAREKWTHTWVKNKQTGFAHYTHAVKGNLVFGSKSMWCSMVAIAVFKANWNPIQLSEPCPKGMKWHFWLAVISSSLNLNLYQQSKTGYTCDIVQYTSPFRMKCFWISPYLIVVMEEMNWNCEHPVLILANHSLSQFFWLCAFPWHPRSNIQ